jgi:hypothetical protein
VVSTSIFLFFRSTESHGKTRSVFTPPGNLWQFNNFSFVSVIYFYAIKTRLPKSSLMIVITAFLTKMSISIFSKVLPRLW